MSYPTTLPASWFTSKAIAELEKRAIFSKTWISLGPVTRWADAGEDYVYDLAEFKFRVSRISNDWKTIKVSNESDVGSEIRHHLTATGLLFVTFSDATVSFDEFFPGLSELLSTVDFTEFPIRRSFQYVGNYNWKTLIDGFQECLHCPYAHPAFSKIYAPTTYKVVNNENYSQHLAETDRPSDGLFLYFFPNSTLNLYGGGCSSFRTWPTEDPSQTIMQFDYYHKSPLESETFENYIKFARTVAIEDHDLCEKAQMNLETGVYTEGILNPDKENGVIYYQQRVLDMCLTEYEKETSTADTESAMDVSSLPEVGSIQA